MFDFFNLRRAPQVQFWLNPPELTTIRVLQLGQTFQQKDAIFILTKTIGNFMGIITSSISALFEIGPEKLSKHGISKVIRLTFLYRSYLSLLEGRHQS